MPLKQLTPRRILVQFAHVLQQDLFPSVKAAVGPLSSQLQLLMSVISLLPLGRLLYPLRRRTGRRARDREALATAFVAKAVLNLPTTRDLMDRLRVDEALRKLCGWPTPQAIPHESKFSRAFAEFAAMQLPQKLHAAVIAATQGQRLIGHIARVHRHCGSGTGRAVTQTTETEETQTSPRLLCESQSHRTRYPHPTATPARPRRHVARSPHTM